MSKHDENFQRKMIAAVADLACRKLTPTQARVFLLHCIEGWSEERIAEAYGCSQSNVHQALWGQGKTTAPIPSADSKFSRLDLAFERARSQPASKGSGAVQKLSAELSSDPTIQALMEELRSPLATTNLGKRDFSGWFASAKYRNDFFAPLAMLIVVDAMADAKGTVSYAALSREVPPWIVNQTVNMLKVMGYVTTDGITVRIQKLPISVPQPVEPYVAALPVSATHVEQDEAVNPEAQIVEAIDQKREAEAVAETAKPVANLELFDDEDDGLGAIPVSKA